MNTRKFLSFLALSAAMSTTILTMDSESRSSQTQKQQQITLIPDGGVLSIEEGKYSLDPKIKKEQLQAFKTKYKEKQKGWLEKPVQQFEFESSLLELLKQATTVGLYNPQAEVLYKSFLGSKITLEQEKPGSIEEFKPIVQANTLKIVVAAIEKDEKVPKKAINAIISHEEKIKKQAEEKKEFAIANLVKAIENDLDLPLDKNLEQKVTNKLSNKYLSGFTMGKESEAKKHGFFGWRNLSSFFGGGTLVGLIWFAKYKWGH